MDIYESLEDIPFNPETYLTIGTYDGVHLGHRLILEKLVAESKNLNKRDLVITFDPHPQIVLKKVDKPELFLLTTIKERLYLLKKFGINNVLIIPFSWEFSHIEAEEFLEELLIKKIGLEKIFIGYDHSFGRNRRGNAELLQNLCNNRYEIEQIPPFTYNNEIVSSTVIRNSLKSGNIEKANAMLGYDYFVHGRVIFGRGMGVNLGFPTANIKPENIHKLLPSYGVYIVYSIIDGVKYYGMANIGVRPTLTNDIKPTLEAHYLDFNGDLYDQELIVFFLHRIRQELKFPNADLLIERMQEDEEYTRNYIFEHNYI
ncbi:MAG TPA: bifunctional riboflavin kinase/FAD synthetase [Candidatus Kapabacteria bacterium]|nr:bifunctional riboflavin kinase/FAD synthetase [Candidatus Kapabacteria bacterium]HRT67827.1 bifunctional riboflavin kinase/FAD synthetase [Bacteroidota bacterium]